MSGETYFLTADISTSSSDCITIAAGGINLQCQGHIISGPSPGSSFRGIFASGKTGITINNCKVINFGYGIRFEGSSNNILTNNNVSSNSYGIYLYQSNNNQLSSNIMQSNSQRGITLETSNNNKILNSPQISNNNYGIYLMNGASNNNITKNNLTNNNYGIYIIAGSQINYIYDNFFKNTNNAFSQGLMNYWNITKTFSIEKSIIGGWYVGGNYWDDYTGVDITAGYDNIGDTNLPYKSFYQINPGGDYLPLVYRTCGYGGWGEGEWCGFEALSATGSTEMNHDCVVDMLDSIVLGKWYGYVNQGSGDLNGDHKVDMGDWSIFNQHYGEFVSPCTNANQYVIDKKGKLSISFSDNPNNIVNKITVPENSTFNVYIVADNVEDLMVLEFGLSSSDNLNYLSGNESRTEITFQEPKSGPFIVGSFQYETTVSGKGYINVTLNSHFGKLDWAKDPEKLYRANFENVFNASVISLSPEISSCIDIPIPGNYSLIQDLSSYGTCLKINANNVILDCEGHTITGDYSDSNKGIFLNLTNNSVIKNCKIQNFFYGIMATDSSNNTFINNLFNNTINAYDTGNNFWNTTKKLAFNENGLVGYWKFDEGTGTTAYDSSGNNNDGTLVNEPEWVDGRYGRALSFDGINDYVEIPDSPELRLNESKGLTIMLWFYRTSYPQYDNVLVSKQVYPGWVEYQLDLINTGNLEFKTWDGYNNAVIGSTSVPDANKWYHVAYVMNNTHWDFYVNGTLKNSGTTSYDLYISNSNLTIGQDIGAATFNGTIDEVKVYDRALSAEEIREDYEKGTSERNIIGGLYFGGNYWSDYTGNDTSIPPDGIGDNKLPYNSSGNITNRGDYLPLVRLDTTPPQYSNIKEPIDPSVYNPSATYNFNINWTDNVAVDDIILEMDWVNYSYKSGQLTKVGDIYSLTFSTCTYGGGKGGGTGRPLMMSMDPITPVIEIIKLLLNGGVVEAQSSPCLITSTHYYRWYAKDTSGNWNSTGMMTFTIYNEDPIVVDIISPENRTYSSNTVDIKYTVSSPFEISWIGYSLDKKPNVTLTGNTTINVNEAVHNIIFYGNTTYGVTNSSQKIYFTVALPKTSTTSIRTTTTTRQTTTIISCTCTAWKPTYICCTGGKGKWTRTCTPKACQPESMCQGPCAV